MAWLAVNKNYRELISEEKLLRCGNFWFPEKGETYVYLPKGSIQKLIGKKLTWEDKPVEIK